MSKSRRSRASRRAHQTYQLQDFWPQKQRASDNDNDDTVLEEVIEKDTKMVKMSENVAPGEPPAVLDYRSAVIRRSSTTSSSRPSTPHTPSVITESSEVPVVHPVHQQRLVTTAATFNYNIESVMDENENQPLKLRNVMQDPVYKEMSLEGLENYIATLKLQLSYKDRKLHFLQNPKPRLAEINYNETLQSAWAAADKLHQSYAQFEALVKKLQQHNEIVLAREMQEKETLKKEIERLKAEVETVKTDRDRVAIEGKNKQESLTQEIIQLRNQLTHAQAQQTNKSYYDPVRTYYEKDMLPKIANNIGQCIEFNHQMNMVLSRMKFQLDPVGIPANFSASTSPVEGMYPTDSPKSGDYSYDPAVPRGC